jgi:magnesium transporter
VIDRVADILEKVQADMDRLAHSVFSNPEVDAAGGNKEQRFRVLLRRIGRGQILTMKARESLVSLQRTLTFLGRPSSGPLAQDDLVARRKVLDRDVVVLLDHASYMSGTITFLLDATLGLLTVEQNAVVKVLSVAAVLFLPPAVVAGIYGMNFHAMPELSWPWGYPMALLLMLISAIVPYLWFKHRRWM